MITLRGLEGASKKLLQTMLTALPPCPDVSVSWGIAADGILNGMRRRNSIEQLIRFDNADLKIPIFTADLGTAKQWVSEGVLVFGRKLLHTMGTDITGPGKFVSIGRYRQQWLESDLWVQVVPDILEEWRLHVFQGKVIARGIKHQTAPPVRVMPVRNRRNGWTIRHDIEPHRGLRSAARKAVSCLGYDFGAVDMLVRCIDPLDVYVLEVNKAPGLDNYTATAYRNAIARWQNITIPEIPNV